ncbi:MAG: adenylate/guanylate cyclase domain-containing protein, partial [Desulfobacterales bacterium]|nr:adenylate/guanylate cyclase domain-containing protein [Desulfobacterales bacterium]
MAVLFTDIVGSTKFFKSHGDQIGREMLQRHHDMTSPIIEEHGGAVLKIVGDSIMAYFFDPKESIKAAIKMQQQFKTYNQRRDARDHIHIRVGIHFGDGIIEEKDIFGDVVNIAAKLIRLVDSDQVYISREVYYLVQDLSPVRYDLVDISGKKDVPKGLTLYRVIWDETVSFDPKVKTLLYLRPVWNLGKDNLDEIWNRLLKSKHDLWGGKIDKESMLSDKSIVLIMNNASSSLAVARDVTSFLMENLDEDSAHSILPIQIIIDSGPYLRADELVIEGLEVNWEEIEPGAIHISTHAYRILKDKHTFSITHSPKADPHRSFYKLTLAEEQQESKQHVFLYQKALVEGENPPCYYCGAKKHLSVNCPSKQMPQSTDGLTKLGYLSLDTINSLFFNYVTGEVPQPEVEMETGKENGSSSLLACYGFYELKEVFQLRFFRTIWSARSENWEKIKESKDDEDKGGFIWIGQDCLRVSNLLQA